MNFQTISALYSSYEATQISTEIHPNDVMFNTGQSHYYTVGQSGVTAVLTALAMSWKQDVSSILDLPCGHGRVTRHLRPLFPRVKLYCCDIDAEGADFCASTFGGISIHSQPDLLRVDLPRNLDVIWIGSLFTHLDKQRTDRWLSYLVDHLSEHGVLVSTFHGYYSERHTAFGGGVNQERLRQQFAVSGFAYEEYTEYPDIKYYGVSLSKPSAIMEIADGIPGARASYIERGWANNHDVLVLTKNDRLAGF